MNLQISQMTYGKATMAATRTETFSGPEHGLEQPLRNRQEENRDQDNGTQ